MPPKRRKCGYMMTRYDTLLMVIAMLLSIIGTSSLIYNFGPCSSPIFSAIQQSWPIGPHSRVRILRRAVDDSTMSSVTDHREISSTDNEQDKMVTRLPKSIIPDSYVLNVVPHIWEGNFTFYSMVKIIVNVTENTDNVTLHAVDMSIEDRNTKVSEISNDGTPTRGIHITAQSMDKENEFFIIELSESLKNGRRYLVEIKYLGFHNDSRHGFFGISYDNDNQTRWIATTDLYPIDARRVFPCFDEPALKATFQINIARPRNMTTISNMPKMGGPDPFPGVPDYAWDRYERSPPMSTYVVAFLIIDFDVLTSPDGNFAIWARHKEIDKIRFSLEIGPAILKYYEDYFQIKYPLPKVDMVVLPDFLPDAMENWGVITFRETALFHETSISPSSTQLFVATSVATELAQQWMGNLVTVDWWDDIWLMQAFSTYLSYTAVNSIKSDWRILEQFIIHELQDSMIYDQENSAHPLANVIKNPKNVDFAHDKIIFGKGSSLIRMIEHSLTTTVFKQGLTNYLTQNAYKSAGENILWNSLTEQARKDGAIGNFTVKEIMHTWTRHTGFPVVTVTRNYENGSAILVQELFVAKNLTANATVTEPEYLWWIPITYTTEAKPDFNHTQPTDWMKAQKSIKLENIDASRYQWVIFNIQQTGYYRVNYDNENWKLITRQLESANFADIPTINRAQLIDDAFQLARAGHLDYEIALGLTTYLAQETEYVPWSAAFTELVYLNDMFIKNPDYDKFRTYVLKLLKNIYLKTGFRNNDDDSQLDKFTTIEVTIWACVMNHNDCIDRATKLFRDWQTSPDPDEKNPIPSDMRYEIYCTGIRVGGYAEWNFAWERYKRSSDDESRSMLVVALGCTRETWLLSRYLEWALAKNSSIRKEDVANVFVSVSRNTIGQPLVFNFMRNNWNRLRQRFEGADKTLRGIVGAATRSITSKIELQDLLDFENEQRENLGKCDETIRYSVEEAETNLLWLDKNYAKVRDWLAKHTE